MQAVNLSSPIVWDAPLNRGLLRWWLCLPNQNRGNVWRELTRKSDATINGATVAGTRGRPGGWGCFEYDGTNDSAQTAAINLTTVTTLTLSFWLYWDAFSNNDDLAFESSATSTTNAGGIMVNPNQSTSTQFMFRVCTVGTSQNGYSFARPSAAVWHHYVCCIDRNAGAQQITAVYVDGVSQSLTVVGTGNNTTSGHFGNHAWNFMCRNNASLFGNGKLDDVRLCNRVLSESEALELYRASRAGYRNELRWLNGPVWFPEEAAPAGSGLLRRLQTEGLFVGSAV